MTDDSTLQTNANTTPDGADPKGTKPPVKTEELEKGKSFNPSELSDAEFSKVLEDKRLWGHDRIKQLQDRAKLAEKLEKEKQEAEDTKLKEQGKLQELLDKRTAELTTLQQTLQSQKVEMAIQSEATKQGVVDVDATLKLIDKSKVTIGDDGAVSGVAEALKSLLEEKPYLTGKGGSTTVGQGSNPGGDGQNAPKRFKASQLKDTKFFRENEADINKALSLGLIEDDLPN